MPRLRACDQLVRNCSCYAPPTKGSPPFAQTRCNTLDPAHILFIRPTFLSAAADWNCPLAYSVCPSIIPDPVRPSLIDCGCIDRRFGKAGCQVHDTKGLSRAVARECRESTSAALTGDSVPIHQNVYVIAGICCLDIDWGGFFTASSTPKLNTRDPLQVPSPRHDGPQSGWRDHPPGNDASCQPCVQGEREGRQQRAGPVLAV